MNAKDKAYSAQYYAEHKDKIRAYNAQYYAEHKDDRRAYSAQYYAEHKDERKAYKTQYCAEHRDENRTCYHQHYLDHKDERKAYAIAYNAEHKDERAAYNAAYMQTDAGRASSRAHSARRRARQGGALSATTILQVEAEYGGLCPYCNKPIVKGHIDHIVPVSRGGTNDRENLVYACAPCNESKSNKTLLEFMIHKRKRP